MYSMLCITSPGLQNLSVCALREEKDMDESKFEVKRQVKTE